MIKFINEGGDKYYSHGRYEFFVIRQTQGYSLKVAEWYHSPHPYIVNQHFSRSVEIEYEAPAPIARIRERIADFLEKN